MQQDAINKQFVVLQTDLALIPGVEQLDKLRRCHADLVDQNLAQSIGIDRSFIRCRIPTNTATIDCGLTYKSRSRSRTARQQTMAANSALQGRQRSQHRIDISLVSRLIEKDGFLRYSTLNVGARGIVIGDIPTVREYLTCPCDAEIPR